MNMESASITSTFKYAAYKFVTRVYSLSNVIPVSGDTYSLRFTAVDPILQIFL